MTLRRKSTSFHQKFPVKTVTTSTYIKSCNIDMKQEYKKEASTLNSQQLEAVQASFGLPLLVLAGPGTGKTRVIVERIKNMVKNGITPSEILCLTFSEKAALEMQERLEKEIDISDMKIKTYHSFCT